MGIQKISHKKPTTQKTKFSIQCFFGKFNQTHKKKWILSYLLKKIFNGNIIFVCGGHMFYLFIVLMTTIF